MANTQVSVGRLNRRMSARQMSPSTQTAYRHWIKRFLAQTGSDQPTPEHARLFLSGLTSRSTQSVARSALKFYFDVLHQPLPKIETADRREPTAPRLLSHSDALRIIDNLTGDSQLIVSLMYGCGLRLIDVLNLRTNNISGKLIQTTHQTAKIPRSLLSRLGAKVEAAQTLVDPHPIGPYLFASPRDPRRHILPTNVQRAVQTAARRLNITNVTPYTFRLSFAARLIEQGHDMITVKVLLGGTAPEIERLLSSTKRTAPRITPPLDLPKRKRA